MKTKIRTLDPYQILFPLGALHALIGGVVWVLYANSIISYPAVIHAHHMFSGFLLSFSAGFLLTAVPRFTGAARCTNFELAIASLISISFLYFNHPVLPLLMLLFISSFFFQRFKSRSFTPPAHFLFLPIGLVFGIIGALISALVNLEFISSIYLPVAKILMFYAVMLFFLLGIGAKLIASILGWAPHPKHQIATKKSPTLVKPLFTNEVKIPLIQALVLILGFVLEIFYNPSLGRSLRAIIATWIAIQNWNIYKLPKARSNLSFWIWTSAWVFIIGLWTHSLFSTLEVHAAHLIFIGGFGLITLLIASRVTIAHGDHSPNIELKSKIFIIISTLAILAAFTRFSAHWTESYFHHLTYAALMWILTVIIWSWYFLPLIFSNSSD